ncbi:MAG: DNA-directed RNA polymerase subunit alpha [bacterium]|nr:DNA-directed RNA polymerase subunit alpha [bacterium]
MEHILLPTRVDYKPGSKDNEMIVAIEPLYSGYGLTIGNALRRVLLSSLSGGAVIAAKIKGADHEFSTLPYVKEDVVDIILNLKRLKFNVHTDEPVKITLHAKGEKAVTGADIEGTHEVEVSTPDVHICTLTNKNAQLEMDLTVRKGHGYFSTEMHEGEKPEVGTILIDATFTPVRNVALHVENARVGQMTNFDRIILTIETDGSITAQDAMEQSCKVLISQFKMILNPGVARTDLPEDPEESVEALQSTFEMPNPEIIEQEEKTEEADVDDEDGKKKRGRPKKHEDE